MSHDANGGCVALFGNIFFHIIFIFRLSFLIFRYLSSACLISFVYLRFQSFCVNYRKVNAQLSMTFEILISR